MNEKNELQKPSVISAMDPGKLNAMVAERAYLKAKKRSFEPGHDLDDWLEAEKEISNQCAHWLEEVD